MWSIQHLSFGSFFLAQEKSDKIYSDLSIHLGIVWFLQGERERKKKRAKEKKLPLKKRKKNFNKFEIIELLVMSHIKLITVDEPFVLLGNKVAKLN